MGTTAAIYTRISSDKSGEAVGVANQLSACQDFIKARAWSVGEIYSDNDISATTGEVRPAFERLLIDCPAVVVAFKQDRLTRDPMDTLRIKAAGITGYLTDGGMLDFSSADAGMLTMIRSVIDAAEGQKKAERQKLRNLGDAKAGKWRYSRPVFGNDRVTGKLIPHEAEAIRTAAKALANGDTTFFKISKDWNAAGFKTPKSAGAGGKDWTPGTVRNFFTAPRLIGKRVYQGTTYTMEGWEPLLKEETFNDIQSLIEAQKTGKRGVQGTRHNPHLLTGIATCGECGGGLNVGYRGGAGSPKNYRCPTPGHVSRTAIPLEKFVVEKFLYLFMHSGAEKVIHPDGADSAAKLRIERIAAVRDHDVWLDEATEAGLSPVVIGKKETAHAKKLADIDARLVEIIRETSFADLLPEMASQGVEALWSRWNDIPVEKQRVIVRSLYKGIVVMRGPQGARFRPQFVKLYPSDLMLQLVELNEDAIEIDVAELSDEVRETLGLP